MTGKGQVHELLGAPEYSRLFTAVRRRLEQGGDAEPRTVGIRGLTGTEREALASLFGRAAMPDVCVSIDLAELDACLRRSRVAAGLREVLEALGGPLRDRRAERRAGEVLKEEFWERARSHPVVRERRELLAWLSDLRTRGLLTRSARAAGLPEEDLLEQALSVLSRLPADGQLLSVMAAETTSDAHALDAGQPLASLVLRACARLAGWPSTPTGTADRRRLWAALGVTCDPLSSNVLVLGLRPPGPSRLARNLRECAQCGEPSRITLRELTRQPLSAGDALRVYIFENPAIPAAAADRLAGSSPPIVCLDGQPSTASLTLLDMLSQSGANLLFHCDFDWAGLRIGNHLVEHLQAAPWRFSAPDYLAAVSGREDGVSLSGNPTEALWDANLTAAMRRTGRAIYEEQMLDHLLSGLG